MAIFQSILKKNYWKTAYHVDFLYYNFRVLFQSRSPSSLRIFLWISLWLYNAFIKCFHKYVKNDYLLWREFMNALYILENWFIVTKIFWDAIFSKTDNYNLQMFEICSTRCLSKSIAIMKCNACRKFFLVRLKKEIRRTYLVQEVSELMEKTITKAKQSVALPENLMAGISDDLREVKRSTFRVRTFLRFM